MHTIIEKLLTENKININAPIVICQCSTCNSAYAIDASLKIEDIVTVLQHQKWHNVENVLYCPTCYEQYKILNSIGQASVNKRPTKHNYYLNIAKEVSSRSTCLRKKYGSVIVKNDIIISTGYNGAPRQTANCIDLNYCRREQMNIPRGQCYELCRSVHSEMNAIINADRESMIDSTLYLYGTDFNGNIVENLDSCQMCKKIIINSGISKVVFARPNNQYVTVDVKSWIEHDETLTDKMGY